MSIIEDAEKLQEMCEYGASISDITQFLVDLQKEWVALERLEIVEMAKKNAERLRINGCCHEAAAVENLIDDLTD
jgi:hypothetical protein